MNKKMSIVLIAIIGIGLYALPSTVALFAGGHTFQNIDATGNQIDCIKCHGDVNVELSSGNIGTDAPHAAFSCELCHRVEAGKASGDNAYSAITYTAVSASDATKTVRKTLIVKDGFAEARDVPATILASASTIPSAAVLISGRTMADSAGYKYKLSACYKSISAVASPVSFGSPMPAVAEVPCDATELAQPLTAPNPKDFQTTSLYNTGGTPKDTTLGTQLGTFDASKVNFDWTGVQSSREPYSWTFSKSTAGLLADGVTQYYGFNGAGSEISNAGTLYHAASLVSCLECHGGEAPTGHHDADYSNGGNCEACHYAGGKNKGGLAGIMAGGFGLGVSPGDTGAIEAHTEFVTTDDSISRFDVASNSACVSCHTHVSVQLTYKKPNTYSAYIDMTSPTEVLTAQEAMGATETHSDGSTTVIIEAPIHASPQPIPVP